MFCIEARTLFAFVYLIGVPITLIVIAAVLVRAPLVIPSRQDAVGFLFFLLIVSVFCLIQMQILRLEFVKMTWSEWAIRQINR